MESREETERRKLSYKVKQFLRHPFRTMTSQGGVLSESTPQKTDGFELPQWRVRLGEPPAVPFDLQYHVYTAILSIRTGIDFQAGQIAGMGFYTTMEKDYKVADTELSPKDKVDQYNEEINLDEKLQQTAAEILAFGNSFWWLRDGDINDILILPVTAIQKIYRNEYGGFEDTPTTLRMAFGGQHGTKLGYQLHRDYGGNIIPPNEMLHFCWNPINNEAFGSGVIRSFCQKLSIGSGESRDEFYKITGKIQKIESLILQKRAMANELWEFEGLSDELVEGWGTKVRGLPDYGGRLTTNRKAQIHIAVPEQMRGLDKIIENLDNEFVLGIGTPLPKLFTTPGFTEASARAAIEVAESRIMSVQRFIKRRIEMPLWGRLLGEAVWQKADVRLNWGVPEQLDTETVIAVLGHLIRLEELAAIKPSEIRAILRDLLHLDQIEEIERPEFVAQQLKETQGRKPKKTYVVHEY